MVPSLNLTPSYKLAYSIRITLSKISTVVFVFMLNRQVFKGTRPKLLSGFFPLRGFPSPTPLTENHFAKKPLAERGVTPLPP